MPFGGGFINEFEYQFGFERTEQTVTGVPVNQK
jgi:hypothetical protein